LPVANRQSCFAISTDPRRPQATERPTVSSSCNGIPRCSRSDGFTKLLKDATMVRLPPWDTPAWRLARELRPLYAAVNRVRDLEATPGASLEEIAAARRAIAAAAVELTRLVDAMRLFEAKHATVRYFGRA
jgi:hypothetical protein